MIDEKAPPVTAYEIKVGQRLTPVAWVDFLESRNDTDKLYWINIAGLDGKSLRRQLDELHANPIILTRCLDADTLSGVFLYDELLAIQLPVPDNWETSSHPTWTILCLPRALITIRLSAANDWLSAVLPDTMTRNHAQYGVAGLLFSLLDHLVDRAVELTLQARHCVNRLETDIDQEANDEHAGKRILTLKRTLAHFEIALEAKHRTMISLLSQPATFIDLPRIHEPLRDVVSHIEHSLRYMERMEDHVSELHQHYLLLLHDRTNHRLRFLTIISTVFMPLTLLASIYGMNFKQMPELGWRYGYPAVLLVMTGIALSLFFYFHRKGWFR